MSIKLQVLHDGAQLVVMYPGFFSHSPIRSHWRKWKERITKKIDKSYPKGRPRNTRNGLNRFTTYLKQPRMRKVHFDFGILLKLLLVTVLFVVRQGNG
jgi:hypothetical protein